MTSTPIRQCVGCRNRFEKPRLVRFTRSTGGAWNVDVRAQLPGRGAYLCSAQCLGGTKKNKKYRGLSLVEVPPGLWKDNASAAFVAVGSSQRKIVAVGFSRPERSDE